MSSVAASAPQEFIIWSIFDLPSLHWCFALWRWLVSHLRVGVQSDYFSFLRPPRPLFLLSEEIAFWLAVISIIWFEYCNLWLSRCTRQKSYFLNWRGRGFTGMQTYSRKKVFFAVWLPFGNVELVYWESHYLRKDYFVKKKSFIKRWPPAPPLRGFMKAYFFYCFFTTFCKKTSQELRMLSRSLSDCNSLLLNLNLNRCLCLCSDCSDCI